MAFWCLIYPCIKVIYGSVEHGEEFLDSVISGNESSPDYIDHPLKAILCVLMSSL